MTTILTTPRRVYARCGGYIWASENGEDWRLWCSVASYEAALHGDDGLAGVAVPVAPAPPAGSGGARMLLTWRGTGRELRELVEAA